MTDLSLQDLKILGVFVILLAGMLGSAAPIVVAYLVSSKDEDAAVRKKKHRRIQVVLKLLTCVSIGIIISTALIHVLPEGIATLEESGNALFKAPEPASPAAAASNASETSNSTNSTDAPAEEAEKNDVYPFGFLFAMCSIVVVYFISTEINWYGVRKLKELKNVTCDEQEESKMAALIKLYILELGVAVHSVIIGLSLGIAEKYSEARILVIVLCVHQFFEGLAVGSLTVAAQVSWVKTLGFFVVFSITTPIGTAVGIGVQDNTSAVARGVVACLAGGILLFTSLCDMLPHVFGAHQHHAHGPLPLAQLHDHVHGENDASHSHSHSHQPSEQSSDSKKSAEQDKEVTVSDGAVIVIDRADDSQKQEHGHEEEEQEEEAHAHSHSHGHGHSHGHDHDDDDDAVVSNTNDEHQDDESFSFRVACYVCIVLGCAAQSVLGIWA